MPIEGTKTEMQHGIDGPLAAESSWVLEEKRFDPSREREMEALFALGNGYLGVRGSLDFPLPSSQADLYVAGVYARKASDLPYSELQFLTPEGRDLPYTEIASFPTPFRLALKFNGEDLQPGTPSTPDCKRILEMKTGTNFHVYRFEHRDAGALDIRTRRCVSLADPHLLLQELEILVGDRGGELELNPSPVPNDFDLLHPHLRILPIDTTLGTPIVSLSRLAEFSEFETLAPSFVVSYAVRLEVNGVEIAGSEIPSKRVTAKVAPHQRVCVRKMISVFSNREIAEPGKEAYQHVTSKEWGRFDDYFREHGERWGDYWDRADLRFEGNPDLTRAQRFNLYHLRIPASPDPGTSIAARALTGRAYEGHIFWDTEVFMLPFYVHTEPEIARSLLIYRHRTLGAARARAEKSGYKGAFYPWESTVTGEDVTPMSIVIKETGQKIPILTGHQQIHITADVAYGVWRYWDATHDADFMTRYGAEMLIETARFWLSRAKLEDGALHIRDVIGPDEYHAANSDDAYTNWMAKFNLERAVWAAEWLATHAPAAWSALKKKLGLTDSEFEEWRKASLLFFIPVAAEVTAAADRIPHGVMEQAAGFFKFDEYPIRPSDRMKPPVHRLQEWQKVARSKLIKQADVLMIPFLFPNAWPAQIIEANYRYYEPLTDHGSSLSLSVHAAAAARAGALEEAWAYWRTALRLDLLNSMGNTALGIHPANIGGAWQALVFHILGVELTDTGPLIPPNAGERLPPDIERVSFRLLFRGKSYPIEVSRKRATEGKGAAA